jgi:hypothetical protein
MNNEPTERDLEVLAVQLGRTARDVHAVAYRCPCGNPAVIETPPRLSDGTPFPTFYYATCPNLTSEISTLENSELMEDITLLMMITSLQGALLESMFQKLVESLLVECQIELNVYTHLLLIH